MLEGAAEGGVAGAEEDAEGADEDAAGAEDDFDADVDVDCESVL